MRRAAAPLPSPRRRRVVPALLILLLAPALAVPGLALSQTASRLTLYPLQGDTVLYRGERTTRVEDGRVTVSTTYLLPDGRAIQHVESVFDAETLAPISHRQLDERSGEQETLTRDGETVRLAYRKTRADKPDEDTVRWQPGMHMSATVGALISREWTRLQSGKTVEFDLLVPSRQEEIGFRLQRDASAKPGAAGRMVVRMEPGSWVIRALVDPIFMEFEEAPPHRLRVYRGRVSLKTDGGKDQDLRIEFHDSP